MPLASTMGYVKSVLDGVKCPGGAGDIEAFIAPPDPLTKRRGPVVYVWTSRGNISRVSGPRSKPPPNRQAQYLPQPPAGWKTYKHMLEIFVVWFNDNADPNADSSYPNVLDQVMVTLQTTQMPAFVTDPSSALQSQLIDLGRDLSWEYIPVRDVAPQRLQRYDALITAPVEEWAQL